MRGGKDNRCHFKSDVLYSHENCSSCLKKSVTWGNEEFHVISHQMLCFHVWKIELHVKMANQVKMSSSHFLFTYEYINLHVKISKFTCEKARGGRKGELGMLNKK